jgi:PAS domain S-box-containing protein
MQAPFQNTFLGLHPVQRRRVQALIAVTPAVFLMVLISVRLLYDAPFLRAASWSMGVCLISAAIVLFAFAAVSRDVSGRTRAERALRQSEERLRQVIRLSHVGVFDHDHRTGEIYWSPEQREMFGAGPHERVTFPDLPPTWNQIHPDDREPVANAVKRAHENEAGPFDIEYRLMRRDGSERWVSNRSQTFFEGEGPARHAVRTVGAIEDITERKRAERQLKLTQASVDQASVGVFWLNPAGQVTYGNECACQSLGVTLRELIGLYVWEFDTYFISEPWVDFWKKIKQAKRLQSKTRYRCKDGSTIPVEALGTYLVFEGEEHIFVFAQDITERERAERDLKMMLAAISASRTPFFSVDPYGRIVYANEQAWLGLGLTREELLGSHVWDFDPDFRPAHQAAYWHEVRRAGELRFESRHRRKDGTIIPILITSNFFSYKNEEYSLVFAQDISERKRAEEALAMFRHSIDRASDPIFWLNRSGGFDYVNDEACRCLGYSHEELLRLHLWDIDTNYPQEKWFGQWEIWESAGRDSVEYVAGMHRRKDGTLIPIETTGQHIWSPGGRSLHVWYVRNVTERKRAEQALRISEERLRQVALVYDIGVFDFDHLTGGQYWSPQLRKHIGLNPGEPGDRFRFMAAVHPDDQERLSAATRHAFDPSGDGHFELQHRILTGHGVVRWLESRSQTFFAGEGHDRHPVRTVGAMVDITSRIEAEEALKESLREKETLLREVHHRVKNNLQIIASLLHFQAKKMKDPEELAAFFEARDRLRSMILVHEKLYQSHGLTRVDFGNYLQSLAGELQRSHGARSARRVQMRVAADEITLPIESALPCGMIVCELLTNIFKYAFPGNRTGTAQIRLTTADGQVRLIVSDDGVGLPPGFDPQQSTSFGWQLIQNLTAQLGGTLHVASLNGTTVSIGFPLQSVAHRNSIAMKMH